MLLSDLPFLNNIINFFDINNLISSDERGEIELTMGDIMDNYIQNSPLSFSSPYFHTEMDNYIITNVIQSVQTIYSDNETLEYEIDEIYETVKKNVFYKILST